MATAAVPDSHRPAPPPAAPEQPQRKLSAELAALAARFREHPVELQEVIAVLQERAYALVIIVLALPFCFPLLPGLSTPFGLVIALIAAALAAGRTPRLPEKLLRTRLPARFFGTLCAGSRRRVGWLERVLRTRWPWMTGRPWLLRLHYGTVCLAAVLLLIPAPLPFSNTLPALGIVLCTAGMLERDGFLLLGGYLFTLAGAAYFALAGIFGIHALDWLHVWWAGA